MSVLRDVSISTVANQQLPHGLPAWAYDNQALHTIEFERIFRQSWQIVGHLSSIPNQGDYMVLDFGPESVIALRDVGGGVRAFHNACRHRAARLLDGAGTCHRVISCPYHGWSYALDGRLTGVLAKETFPGLDMSPLGLKPVRTEIMLGFVFVTLSDSLPPVAETWGPLLDDLAPYGIERMQPLGDVYFEEWDVDWKVAMDNYLESYHVPIGHPGLFRMFTPDFEEQETSAGGVARGISRMRSRESTVRSERQYQRLLPTVAMDLPEPDRAAWRFYSMLPNLGIDVFPDQMDFFQVLPRGPGRCVIRGACFALPDGRRDMKLLRYLNARINRQVQREDAELCHRVQRGYQSSSYEPGPLSSLEGCMIAFHDVLRERIPELRRATAPERFA